MPHALSESQDGTGLTIDHLRPLALRGRDQDLNFVAACAPCNRNKGRRPPVEDELWRAFMLKRQQIKSMFDEGMGYPDRSLFNIFKNEILK